MGKHLLVLFVLLSAQVCEATVYNYTGDASVWMSYEWRSSSQSLISGDRGYVHAQYDDITRILSVEMLAAEVVSSTLNPRIEIPLEFNKPVSIAFSKEIITPETFDPIAITGDGRDSPTSDLSISFFDPETLAPVYSRVIPNNFYNGTRFTDGKYTVFSYWGKEIADHTEITGYVVLRYVDTQPVPEPATSLLLLSGLAPLARKLRYSARS